MAWVVSLKRSVEKQVRRLPLSVKESLYALLIEIEKEGPVRWNWANYGKLSKNRHHCHLKKGQPTYVAVWEVKTREIQLVEVVYVGSHEKAPY
jgi:mRNA-degrading endonuclease RelE of RelBE toxin-antitoxin system